MRGLPGPTGRNELSTQDAHRVERSLEARALWPTRVVYRDLFDHSGTIAA